MEIKLKYLTELNIYRRNVSRRDAKRSVFKCGDISIIYSLRIKNKRTIENGFGLKFTYN